MLFKSTDKLLEYADMDAEINFASLKNTLRIVEEQYLLPILGPELYGSLNSAYALITNEDNLAANNKLLLDRCRMVVGPYLVHKYAGKAEVRLTDAGLRRQETANSKSAFQDQATNFREAYLLEGEAATEQLLLFLEENRTIYTQWVASKAFAQYRSLFIHTAKEFETYYSSASPYRNFYAMRSKMQDVEENQIRPALGDVLFDVLKSIDQSPHLSFSPLQEKLMFRIKKAIAYLTVGYSIPFLNVRVDANGITVVNAGPRSTNDKDASRAGAGDTAISRLATSALDTGQKWLSQAKEFIETNRPSFAPYLPAPQVIILHPGNEDLKGSFGMC